MCVGQSAQGPASCPIINEIAAFFPALEGYIVEVKEDKIFLDLGRQSGVKKGMEFLCIREGERLTHPVTGDTLGRFEDKLGFIQISEIEEQYSIGHILQIFSGQIIKRGDKVRITSSKIPIAFTPDLPSNPTIDVLVEGLQQSGRFSIIPNNLLLSVLNEAGLSNFENLTPSLIKKISENLDIFAFIIPSIENLGQKDMINVRIISAQTGVLITEMRHECSADAITSISQTASATSQAFEDSFKKTAKFMETPQEGILAVSHLSQDLPISIRHMAIGDVTGNGKNEICVTDGRNIMIYKWQEGKLERIAEVKGTASEDHLSLDIADINKNRHAEIYVSNLERGSLQSFALEWQGDRLERILERVPLFLRIMPVYPNQKVLLGQGMGMTEPFDAHISEYQWVNDTFTSIKKIKLPHKVNIFNIGMADFDHDGTEELVYLHEKLWIYRDGKKIWKSDLEYGGKSVFFEYKSKGAFVSAEEEKRVYLPSHFTIQDLNGNGIPDIMLIKNISLTGYSFPYSRLYRKGEACLIEWNGISFSEVWRSGHIDAYLTDIVIGDMNSDGQEDLGLSLVLASGVNQFWKTNPSKILFY